METPITPAEAARLGCRPGDMIDKTFIADRSAPSTFSHNGREYLGARSENLPQHIHGMVGCLAAVWVRRDVEDSGEAGSEDPARLSMVSVEGRNSEGDRQGYLPILLDADPKLPDWAGQEATGFPDNWTIGLSFLHNVFAREHNQFVDEFRRRATRTPEDDSGLRNPSEPNRVIRYRDVTADELFDVARLVVSAEIAKIHTIEWTTQLLYNEPLFMGMNGNWGGVLDKDNRAIRDVITHIIEGLRESSNARRPTTFIRLSRAPSASLASAARKTAGASRTPTM